MQGIVSLQARPCLADSDGFIDGLLCIVPKAKEYNGIAKETNVNDTVSSTFIERAG